MDQTKILGMPSDRGRWILVPFSMIIFLCAGTVYSWSIFKIPLEKSYGITATESGVPYMTFLVCYAIFMLFTGKLIERFGPRMMMIIGSIAVGVGWVVSGFAANIQILSFSYGVIAGGGVGIVYGAPLAVISKWFPKRKGLLVGIVLLGFGLSPFITAPIARWLITETNVFQTFKLLGIAFLLIMCILSLPFKFPTEQKELYVGRGITIPNEDQMNELNAKQMIKKSKFYGLWTCYAIGTLVGLMIIGIASAVGQEVIRLDSDTSAKWISFFAIFNGLGRPLFGWITDRLSPWKASVIAYGIMIVASLLMLVSGEGVVFIYVISFSLLWLTLGGWLAIAPTSTATFFGLKYYSENYGIVFTAYGVGAIGGVLLSGMIRDAFGTYQFVFYPIIILAGLGIFIAMKFLKEKNINV